MVSHGKDYLNTNYVKATIDNNGNIEGVFVKKSNGIPTKKSVVKQDLLDDLDREFNTRIPREKERNGFVNQLFNDWYYNNISKNNSLTNYNW